MKAENSDRKMASGWIQRDQPRCICEETVEWQSTTDAAAGTPGIVNDHRLDRFTGTYSSALE